jgi:uncharacterized membrane protein
MKNLRALSVIIGKGKLLVLIGIFLLALFLRVSRLRYVSVWFDEYLSLQVLKFPVSQILKGSYLYLDSHPPLYYIILKMVGHFLSSTELAYRGLSLALSIASIIVIFELGRELINDVYGLGAAFLLALNTMNIYYSTEIRQYSFLVFLSLVALLGICKKGFFWRIITIIALVSASYTHYFGIIVIAMAFALAWARHEKERWIDLAVAMLLSVPTFYYFIQNIKVSSYTYPHPLDLRGGFSLVANAMNFTGYVSNSIASFSGIVQIGNVLASVFMIYGWTNLWKIGQKRLAMAFLIVLGGYSLGLWFFSWYSISFNSRYIIPVSIFSVLIISGAFVIKKTGFQLTFLFAIGCFAAFTGIGYAARQEHTEIYPRETASAIRSNIRPGEPLIILGWDLISVQYYLGDTVHFQTSYDFEKDLADSPTQSYLLVDSPAAIKVPQLKDACLIFSTPKTSIYRYYTQQKCR